MKKRLLAILLCFAMILTTSVYVGLNGEAAFAEGPSVEAGTLVWAKEGTFVYSNTKKTANDRHKLQNNYQIKVKEVKESADNVWYRFDPAAIKELKNHKFKWILAEDVSMDNPVNPDSHACNCGMSAPENLADHADSCPRKQYIKTLFEGKTAEEIYLQWGSYNEATKDDLLEMLQRWDYNKYEELKAFIDDEDLNETTEDGLTVSVSGSSIPRTVSLSMNEVEDAEKNQVMEQISSVEFDENTNIQFRRVIDLKLYDNGTEWQPGEGQFVNVQISGKDSILGKFLTVTHILDTEAAIRAAIANGTAISYSDADLSEIYPRETAAAKAVSGKSDTIYYTELSNESGGIRYTDDGGIEFTLDSFSEIQIIGYTLNNQRDMPDLTAEDDSGSIILDKNVEWIRDDEYKLTLEAYSTGQKETKATDVVFIIDQSCSMYSAVDPTAEFGGATADSSKMTVATLKSMDMSKAKNKKAALEGYYVAVFHDSGEKWYTIPVRYHNGKWQRTSGDGSVSYNMWVSETIQEVWNGSWIDLTDTYTGGQTFTIYKSVYGAAYDAMESFVNTMAGENGEGTPNCRASIVGFSCPYSGYGNGPMNTGLYIDGSQKFGLDFTTEQYRASFNDMSTAEGLAAFRNSVNAIRTSGQTTTTDAGFKLAKDVLENASDAGAERVVILFTDGKPENQISDKSVYDNYTAAIATANTVKRLQNTTVYTYGIELGSVTTDFLKALSSSYPNATSQTNLGNRVEPQCWGMASNSADIQQSFAKIAQQIVSSSVAWDASTKLKDVIADEFKLPDGTTVSDITVKTAAWNGSSFAAPVAVNNMTVTVSGDNVVDVSGFDYSKNFVTQGVAGGKKLIVEVPIVVDRTVCQGGNDLETNTKDSALWSGSIMIKPFPVPEVDVMTNVTVRKTVRGEAYNDTFALEGVYEEFKNYSPNKGKDLTSIVDDKIVSESITDKGSVVLSKVKVGTALKLEETDADKYRMTAIVKDKDGNTITDGIEVVDGKILISSVVPGMQIELVNTALFADLTINKTGIQSVDHHDEDKLGNKKERQSTIYTVTNGDDITMDVVIVGNDSVTIQDLPVGSYSVTERRDWSWRYVLDSINAERDNDEIVAGDTISFDLTYDGEIVNYKNARFYPYWLSGDSYCRNWWDGSNGTVIRQDAISQE